LLLAPGASAQVEDQEPPHAETHATSAAQDGLLPQITAALHSVAAPDIAALAKALRIGEPREGGAPGSASNTVTQIGDLDGDGVPEMLLKWAIPDVPVAGEVAPAPESEPLWSVYLLSWDGARWKASRLVTDVENFTPVLVNLGPPVGRGVALVIKDPQVTYPAVFQLKDHAATLVWDAQSDDSRYESLLQGEVTFHDRGDAPAEMMVTGRADPGFLRVNPNGQRGFRVSTLYRWDGKSFVPAKAEYAASEDYTLYRFISALHLHDYASAYALVVPARFLKDDSPSLDKFRGFIQNHFPEFLQDEVFEAPELAAGSPDEHAIVLDKSDKRYVYHPDFSRDGKFLLTGLTRAQAASEP